MAVLDREMGKSWVNVGSGLWNDKMGDQRIGEREERRNTNQTTLVKNNSGRWIALNKFEY